MESNITTAAAGRKTIPYIAIDSHGVCVTNYRDQPEWIEQEKKMGLEFEAEPTQ